VTFFWHRSILYLYLPLQFAVWSTYICPHNPDTNCEVRSVQSYSFVLFQFLISGVLSNTFKIASPPCLELTLISKRRYGGIVMSSTWTFQIPTAQRPSLLWIWIWSTDEIAWEELRAKTTQDGEISHMTMRSRRLNITNVNMQKKPLNSKVLASFAMTIILRPSWSYIRWR